jgi:hypothetical protein
MIACEGFHPVLVVGSALAQDLPADHGDANDLMEEVHHPLGSRQRAEVAVYDDAVEAVVDEGQQAAEQLGEQVHGKPRATRWGSKIKQIVEGGSIRLADEVRYIQQRAANHDGRIVTIGQLILFSTETGDAWLLDRTDLLAARLAQNGEAEPIQIVETAATFAIEWKGSYRINGPAFVYSDRDTGRVITVLGYPTDKLVGIK